MAKNVILYSKFRPSRGMVITLAKRSSDEIFDLAQQTNSHAGMFIFLCAELRQRI